MKLYYLPGSCALVPHIVLEWVGVEYELEKVARGDPEYLKINPLGQVPALADEGKILTQTDAILQYLANKYPRAQLGNNGTLFDKYEIDHWLAFLTGDFHPAFGGVFKPERFTTDKSDQEFKAIKEAAYIRVDRVLSHLDKHLQGKDYIVGGRRTIVDAYAFAMSRWARTLPKPLSEYKDLARFVEVLKKDPGVQSAMKKQGLEI